MITLKEWISQYEKMETVDSADRNNKKYDTFNKLYRRIYKLFGIKRKDAKENNGELKRDLVKKCLEKGVTETEQELFHILLENPKDNFNKPFLTGLTTYGKTRNWSDLTIEQRNRLVEILDKLIYERQNGGKIVKNTFFNKDIHIKITDMEKLRSDIITGVVGILLDNIKEFMDWCKNAEYEDIQKYEGDIRAVIPSLVTLNKKIVENRSEYFNKKISEEDEKVAEDNFVMQIEKSLSEILSESQYEEIKDVFPKHRKPPKISNLTILNAVFYILETKCKWKDLPLRFGDSHVIYNRVNRWARNGILLSAFNRLELLGIVRIETNLRKNIVGESGKENRKEVEFQDKPSEVGGVPTFMWLDYMPRFK